MVDIKWKDYQFHLFFTSKKTVGRPTLHVGLEKENSKKYLFFMINYKTNYPNHFGQINLVEFGYKSISFEINEEKNYKLFGKSFLLELDRNNKKKDISYNELIKTPKIILDVDLNQILVLMIKMFKSLENQK